MKYTLVEEASYTEEVERIGDTRRMDEALHGIMWGLATNPSEFDPIPNLDSLRIAKTKPWFWHGGVIPALSVLFQVDENACRVHLLAIKAEVPQDDDELL